MNSNESSLPILDSEVCNEMLILKNGISFSPDNIPSELLKHGEKSIIKIFTTISLKIWKTRMWPAKWTKSRIIIIYTYPEK